MKAASATLLRWTRFTSDPHGTGPEKRSAQILALCREAGFEISDMQPPASVPFWRTRLGGWVTRRRYGAYAGVYPRSIGLLGFYTEFYRQALARHQGVKLLLWETTYDTMLPTMAREAGFRVVALPHNLESLVSEAAFADPGYDPMRDLSAEVTRLKLADEVFTIAKEERWLLETRGLAPRYLPFYPDPSLIAECGAVRARRAARAGSDGRVHGPLLILGSAFNPATSRGMALQLEWLARSGTAVPSIIVAGAHSDVVLAAHARSGVELLGRITRERLLELLASCSALLIHTFGGAGALTRIPEALLAGIPIIANSNASRDQFGTPGVHGYETEGEFAALAANPPAIPPAPPYPTLAAAQFQAALSRLVNLRPS